MKFKVGDKVVVSPKANPLLGGLSGIVVETQESPIADTAYYKVDLDEERVFPEHHLIAETEYRFLTELNVTAHQPLATCGIKATDSDTKVLRAKDGTIIGDFSTGGVVNIHDLPTSEWYNPTSGELIVSHTEMEKAMDRLSAWATNVQLDKETVFNGLSQVLKRATEVYSSTKEEKNLKFTFYVTEGTRIDKTCNKTIPTITTHVEVCGFDDWLYRGTATCDKVDYSERQGVLEAFANAMLGDNFERNYNKAIKWNKSRDLFDRTCPYCGKVFDTVEEKQAEEAWHVERKKARRERYLLRKRAKEIAFEEQAQKMAKEMMGEQK